MRRSADWKPSVSKSYVVQMLCGETWVEHVCGYVRSIKVARTWLRKCRKQYPKATIRVVKVVREVVS